MAFPRSIKKGHGHCEPFFWAKQSHSLFQIASSRFALLAMTLFFLSFLYMQAAHSCLATNQGKQSHPVMAFKAHLLGEAISFFISDCFVALRAPRNDPFLFIIPIYVGRAFLPGG
jgi:hypothetical protein